MNRDVGEERLAYSTAEAARLLGIGRSTLFDLMRQRKIEFVKDGRIVRIRREAIERYLEQHTFSVLPIRRRLAQ